MNKQPVYYMQTDSRWKDKPYRTKGENSTVGGSGCGPSCAAMLIETLTGKTFTPLDACNWSMEHNYKALNQGTYYGYFKPQFAAFGISCEMLNYINTYGSPNHQNHETAFAYLKKGYYLIACMGKGNWTSSGHFIVVWWEDGKVRINDPASTKAARLSGDLYTFKSQVKYYWIVDARAYNNGSTSGGSANNANVKDVSYRAKTNTGSDSLNIRSTYSTSGAIVGKYENGTTVTITKECGSWGYADGKGWIYLPYTVKIETTTTTTGEDDYMTKDEILKELGDQYIATYDDLPNWAKPEVRELLDAGIINGGTDISVDANDIGMFLSDIKTIIVAKRLSER